MKLHYKEFGHGRPLLILHGLFGMLDNWQYHARCLSEHFHVFTLDVRNHGHSGHSDIFNYDAMADDLLEFARDHQLLRFNLLGHSMGGKIVMNFAQQYPDFVEKLIVADIGPRAYPVHHSEILDALSALDLDSISSRSEADNRLSTGIPDLAVRQFLLKSLYWKEKGKLSLRFNLQALRSNIEEVGRENYHRPYFGPTLFIYGTRSNYIVPERDTDDIKTAFPAAEIKALEGAGHWLHAEQPDAFCRIVLDFLKT
jgi:pimeloyl-ACP methyl ester carboxylesterase